VNRNFLPEFNPRRKNQDVHARTLIQNRASLQGWRGLQFICGLRGNKMKTKSLLVLASMMSVLLYGEQNARAQGAVPVHVVITDAALQGNAPPPRLDMSAVKVTLNKKAVKVTQLVPARGDAATLQLFVLIDDTLDTSIGNHLQELKDFLKAQPGTTQIGVGYMSNATFQLSQNFTGDRNAAINAIRLPRGNLSTMDSPYLSLISLVKSWPKQNVRREVLMVTDGIDRLRGERPVVPRGVAPPRQGAGGTPWDVPNFGPGVYHSMPQISVDASSASEISQRYNVIVYSIYGVGVGRAGRSEWDLQLALGGLTKIADETGGECFSMSTTQLVSFKPYLDRLANYLNNQYFLEFAGVPKGKGGLQRVRIDAEIKNSEVLAPDNVWVGPPEVAKK